MAGIDVSESNLLEVFFIAGFYELSQMIEGEKDIRRKIKLCHEQLAILPGFVESWLSGDSELPPIIMCRDVGPELYMRLGMWEDASRFIHACIDANAYYPNRGEEQLEHLALFKEAADTALNFIDENPGFLQKDIYKALPNLDKECLKHFLRCSLTIRKEPCGKTNRLYVA